MTSRILIVDDSVHDTTLILHALMDCHGDHVYENTGDSESAYRVLSERRFDLVVLDITLPDVDGFELMRWLNQDLAYQVPVLIVSQSALDSHKYLASKLGAVDYVEKTLDFAEFKTAIRTALKRQGLC